jgi:hypothetical protein
MQKENRKTGYVENSRTINFRNAYWHEEKYVFFGNK